MFVERFLSKLSLLLRGTTSAPAARFGETLQEEQTRGGCFGVAQASSGGGGVRSRSCTPRPALLNADLRLYGGAQYNRAMAEFRYDAMHLKRGS
jgi:hypothetical protein